MPRVRKTQAPQTPGLEAGAAYGEVSDSLEAQQAIPLPQKQAGEIALPQQANVPAVQAPAPRGPLPLEAGEVLADVGIALGEKVGSLRRILQNRVW